MKEDGGRGWGVEVVVGVDSEGVEGDSVLVERRRVGIVVFEGEGSVGILIPVEVGSPPKLFAAISLSLSLSIPPSVVVVDVVSIMTSHPLFNINVKTTPSLIPSYSLINLSSLNTFPFNNNLWNSGKGDRGAPEGGGEI